MNLIQKIGFACMSIILAFSLGVNLLLYKGMTWNIDKSITNHQHQEQFQFQGQLLINQWASQGDTIDWKELECERSMLLLELNKMHPVSSFYSKVVVSGNDNSKIKIIYPTIFNSK